MATRVIPHTNHRIEIYVSAILDHAEFRKHCDAHRTRSAILTNLR